MTASSPRPFHAVVGYDLSPLADAALNEAARRAALASAAEIHLITVAENGEAAAALPQEVLAQVTDRVSVALRDVRAKEKVQVFWHVHAGDTAAEILALAEDVGADLITVGTHGRRGVKRVVLGSVAERVVREASCPVLVARPCSDRSTMRLRPEPPCESCVSLRASSGGAETWCAVHSRPWTPPHRYAYRDGTLHPFHADGLDP